MTLYDAIVVGSGPAGTFAAYGLRGRRVLVLDVGYRPPDAAGFDGNLYDLRQARADLFEELIGRDFEGLHNLHRRKISLKLKAPYMSYIVRDWTKFMPVASSTFEPVASFALGGLANAWGAGVFRFNDRDLQAFPIHAGKLRPFYDEVASHIGVSGTNGDDLARYFGEEPEILPPLRVTKLATHVLQQFQVKKEHFQRQGISVGLCRLAVLTRPHNGRSAYRFDNLEFYKPYNPAIYNPVFTLDELARTNQVCVRTGYLVSRYTESHEGVAVTARNLATGAGETFHARTVVLAAGTLGTTKIVLESNGDYTTRLPILDNPMACIPLLRANRIGEALEINDSALAQLSLVYEDPDNGELLQGGVYGTTGPLRSDVLFDFPLSIGANLTCARLLSPAMLLLMLFYPGRRDDRNYIRLKGNGTLEANYEWKSPGRAERNIIRAFRKIGYWSSAGICQYPPMGSSLHYAGTLPMKALPGRYETDSAGRLSGTRAVYVADGACFTELPAKNLTFTIMANALRIGSHIRGCLE